MTNAGRTLADDPQLAPSPVQIVADSPAARQSAQQKQRIALLERKGQFWSNNPGKFGDSPADGAPHLAAIRNYNAPGLNRGFKNPVMKKDK